VMGINISGERSERAVRHPYAHRGHVLERIRHGKEQESHKPSLDKDASKEWPNHMQ